MKIAYIFSMKNGIAPFIYSELMELEKNQINFKIFPTKYKEGLCMPKESWEIYRFNPAVTILKQPLFFLKNPFLYSKLLLESISTNSLIPFLVACDFSTKMTGIDRIHCHFGDTKLFIGYYCKRLTSKKLSVAIHAHELYQKNKKMFRIALNLCDQIIAESEYNKKCLVEMHNIDPKRIIVNRQFVDITKFSKNNKFKILMVAQWHEKKGHRYLFEAIKKLNREDIELWIVGGMVPGYAEVDVKKLAKTLDIEDKVSFFGELKGNALLSIYNTADIFVLPSYTTKNGDKEGTPISLMEAMAFELPVISTNHAGIPEIVDQILVKEKSAQSLADAIVYVMRKKDEWKKMGKHNRRIVIKKYSQKNVKSLLNIFEGSKIN